MKFVGIIGLTFLVTIGLGFPVFVFADSNNTPLISASTDFHSYENGDRVYVNGVVQDFDPDIHSNIELFYRIMDSSGNIVTIGLALPDSDGAFSFNFVAGGTYFKENGVYTIELLFGEIQSETTFLYTGGVFEPALAPSTQPSDDPKDETDEIDEKIKEIEKIADENEYQVEPREWQTSGPFQVDRQEYALGEKIFIRIGGLSFQEKGEVAVMRPLNNTHYSVYLTIPFDGTKKDAFNYYLDPQLSKTRGLCSIDDVLGSWALVFRGTNYPNLNFEITKNVIPGLGNSFEKNVCLNENEDIISKESQNNAPSLALDAGDDEPTPKIPDWVKNTMGWYVDGLISEDELISAIQYLINEKILVVN